MAVRLLDYAFEGNLRKVKRCINSGVDVDACESSGNSALYHAVSRNNQKCVKYLLSCRADPNRINHEGYTPVNEACVNNNVKCLALLVQYGGSLDKLCADHKESAIVSGYKKKRTKVVKFIRLLKDEALTKDGHDLLELEAEQKQKEVKIQTTIQSVVLPGLEAVIPQITCGELKSPYIKLFDDMPHMTLQSALWHSTPVTVKRFKEQGNSRQLLLKEADLLSWLRHPRVSLLMAVCLGPQSQHFCLVMEHFQLASLNHVLYKAHIEMNLPERVHLLLDVAEGMTFLHSHSIVHGFLNPFSVFVYEKFRAKIGNLSFAQEDGEQKLESACSAHENWMAPEQLLHEPPNIAGDIYSFGVLMWETLARKLPWSWLTCTIKQAMCHHQMTLPMLEIWPGYIRSIMAECLQDPEDRPCFRTLHESLFAIKNSGDGLTSEVLDGAFPDWFESQHGNEHIETRRRRKRSLDLPYHSSTCRTSEIYLMLRHSSCQGNTRRRSTSAREGLREILKAFSRRTQNSPREKEIERFGYEIAERLAVVRNILGVSRNYKRARWAREVVLTRVLEGDIERVIRDEKTATSTKKSKESNKSSRHGRRYSDFHQETFESLLVTASKYQKEDWSKVVHGKEKLKNSIEGFKGKVNEELSEYRRTLLTDDDSISKEASQDSLALLLLWENNRETLKPNTTVAGNEFEQHLRSRTKAINQEFKETFLQSTNSREDTVKLKGGEQSAETINEADSSSSNDCSERLRARSLGPTEPRARSARHIRIDSAHALSARGKSDASAVVSDTEGTSPENTALTDEDVGNGRLHRFSKRPDNTQGNYLSSTPLKKISFSSNEDWRDVAKRNSAGNGEKVSSVPIKDLCHLRN